MQGPVDPGFTDAAAAAAEVVGWVPFKFTATIPKPTGIAQLIGELSLHGVIVWWDAKQQKVRLQSNRPRLPEETLKRLSGEANFAQGTSSVMRLEDKRISTLILLHGVIDPTARWDEGENYSRAAVARDPSSASDNENGEERIVTVFSRWLGAAGNDAAATVIAERLVNRYRGTPREFSAVVLKKDAVDLADRILVSSELLPDVTGQVLELPMQIRRVTRGSAMVEFSAEQLPFEDRFGFWMDEATDELDYDLAAEAEKAVGAYWIDENETAFPDGGEPYKWF